MSTNRRETKIIKIGNLSIGSRFPVAIQSMLKCKTSNVKLAIKEIEVLQCCGCEIVRVAVKDILDAKAIKHIKQGSKLPIVADIHFDWKLAIASIESGVDKIRLNPGNIFKSEEVKQIVKEARLRKIPIRVGLNSGSLPPLKGNNKKVLSVSDRLVNGADSYIKKLEDFGFSDIVISLKASTIKDTIEAYRKMSGMFRYPLHLGLTATGLPKDGAIKSAIAIGALLIDGIGDTIRVSLTAKPEEEVQVAKSILSSCNLRHFGPEVISCPTCGRCEVNLVKVVKDLESKLSTGDRRPATKSLKVAVMGCVVNGPGEAKEADIGIAFGKKEGLFFKKGKAIKKVNLNECVSVLAKEIGAKHDKDK